MSNKFNISFVKCTFSLFILIKQIWDPVIEVAVILSPYLVNANISLPFQEFY